MRPSPKSSNARLRRALETAGYRFTEQRAAVYRFLCGTTSHPRADEVFRQVRTQVPGISLATVYKSLETLVNCGLAAKLTYGDGSARYDGRTDPHHHAHCVSCDKVMDAPGRIPDQDLDTLGRELDGFFLVGYRLELTGFCENCRPPEEEGDSTGAMN